MTPRGMTPAPNLQFSPRLVPSLPADKAAPLPRRLVEREDRLDRARRDARPAVDALVGVNIEHVRAREGVFVLARVDAVHRTDIHARGVLRSDARLADDIGHLYDVWLLAS